MSSDEKIVPNGVAHATENGILTENPIVTAGVKLVNNIGKSPAEILRENVKDQVTKIIGDRKIRAPIFMESMTQAEDPVTGARIRVWRAETETPEYNDTELQLLINKIPGRSSMQDVINILSTVERVTAVELVDAQGNGVVSYFEW